MLYVIFILFYAGVGAFCYGAAQALLFGRGRRGALVLGARAAYLGAFLFGLTLALRLVHFQRLPFTSVADTLMLLLIAASSAMAFVLRHEERRGLVLFYLPPLAALALMGGWFGIQDLPESPRELTTVLLVIHVGLAFLAYALSLVVCLTGMAYIFQVQQLKQRQTRGLFQRLPSLEQLDHALHGLISAGYLAFAISLGAGFFWAWFSSELLAPYWWVAPKILISVGMIGLYAASYHARALGWLRGPKLAYLMVGGFGSLLSVYLVLELLHMTNYNFFEGGLG